jgi:hypothetical protein
MSNTRSIGSTFDSGLRIPNYVNGRLLHAEDLHADQEATLARLSRLGQAAGAGIVAGLTVQQVAGSSNSIQISPGVGLNPRGDIIHLEANPVTLSLVIEPEVSTTPGSGGLFQPCAVATPGEQVVIEAGAYLLTVIPVSRMEGSTPITTPASRGNTVECAARWIVEGLEFKAIRLHSFGDGGVDAANNAATLRNRLAHWCLGITSLGIFPAPEGDGAYNGLDLLGADDRTPCDLPLAVFYWAGDNGIQFVDMWAARRRVAPAYLVPAWGGMLGDKRPAEGEARLIQFQTHLDHLISTGTPASIAAANHFPYLPPCGFVPALPPEGVLRYVGGRLLALLLTGGTRTDEYPFPENFAYLANYWEQTKQTMIDDMVEHVEEQHEEQSGQGVRLATFWGDLLPNDAEVISSDEMDTLLRERLTHDAIALAQRPALRLAYPEAYLLQYLGAALLDGIQYSQFDGVYDILELVHLWVVFLGVADEQTPADEWLLRSLSRYLGLPQSVLLANMQRDDLVYALFCRAEGERVAFDIPREESDDTGNQPPPIGDFVGNLSGIASIRANELSAALNRPNISGIEATSEIMRIARPQGAVRGEITRDWRRAIRRRRRLR